MKPPKQAMIWAPVLAMQEFHKPFVMEMDALVFGLGAVKMVFHIKLLGPRAQLNSVYEKELMVVCLAVQKWCHYLLGHHFVIRIEESPRYIV